MKRMLAMLLATSVAGPALADEAVRSCFGSNQQIEVQIRYSKVDYRNGQMIPENSHWVKNRCGPDALAFVTHFQLQDYVAACRKVDPRSDAELAWWAFGEDDDRDGFRDGALTPDVCG